MEGKGINQTSTMIEDGQIANVQSPARAQAGSTSPLENVTGPNSPNSPTYVEDLPSDVDSEFEDENMEEMEDYMEDNLLIESKIKALEKRVENLMVENTLLQYEALCYQIIIRMLEIKTARSRAVNTAYLKQRGAQDAELRAVIELRQILEHSLANFPGTSWIPKNPGI